jgi:hypothetical protein
MGNLIMSEHVLLYLGLAFGGGVLATLLAIAALVALAGGALVRRGRNNNTGRF